jgi:uncharacterized protein
MARPCKVRCVGQLPPTTYFKPRGVPLCELEEVVLALDELEAVRWVDGEGFYHAKAALQLEVSRQTLGNILESARHKIADALVYGKALKLEGGFIRLESKKKDSGKNKGEKKS